MSVVIDGTTGVSGVNGSASTPAVQGEDTNTGVFFPAADTVAVATDGSERMRIDSSGNLLFAKTSANTNTVGIELRPEGFFAVTRDLATANSDAVMTVDRRTTEGDIIRVRKDGSTVGSIGAGSGELFVDGAVGDCGIQFGGFVWKPRDNGAAADNAVDIGNATFRFDDIYATNATINTSDRNEKQDIRDITESEARVAQACKGLLKAYRWKDAVAEKGEEARIHFGIIAQDLQAAFEAEGLDAGRYAMFIHSTWTDEGTGEERNRMGVRYPELLAFIIAAM